MEESCAADLRCDCLPCLRSVRTSQGLQFGVLHCSHSYATPGKLLQGFAWLVGSLRGCAIAASDGPGSRHPAASCRRGHSNMYPDASTGKRARVPLLQCMDSGELAADSSIRSVARRPVSIHSFHGACVSKFSPSDRSV